MKKVQILLVTALFSTFLSCVNGDDYGTPDLSNECVTETVTKTVNEIAALATTNNPTQHNANDIIEAFVTSSDEGGNFYKTLSLVSVDKVKGFTVPVNAYNLYTKYKPGTKVYIKLKDLYYSKATLSSSLEIGDYYYTEQYGAEIGRIAANKYESVILRSCQGIDEEDLVNHVSINEAKNDSYLHKLIEFTDVKFTETSEGGKYYDAAYPNSDFSNPTYPSNIGGATNHQITDASGNTLIVRVSQYATFAGDIVPTGTGKIRGVLTKYNGGYQFMIRTINDVNIPFGTEEPGGEEPGGEEPGNGEPGTGTLAFLGGDFENWADFTGSLNSFGLQSYATQSAGTGGSGTNSLHISTSGAGGNDYVFTAFPYNGLPTTPTAITFWVKGTSSKSISLNVYYASGSGSGYARFNLGTISDSSDLTLSAVTANQYTGTIDTGGNWKKVVLDLTTISETINTTNFTNNFFALKVGSGQPYDLHFDNFIIE